VLCCDNHQITTGEARGSRGAMESPFGLMVAMILNIFLLPTLYVWIARGDDALPDSGGEAV
jgi:hypothetical protein